MNTARSTFLDPRANALHPDWVLTPEEAVGALRTAAGKTPFDRASTDLIGELSTRSDPFRTWTAAKGFHLHRVGTKRVDHRTLGEMTLSLGSFAPPRDGGLSVVACSAEPGSASAEELALLGSWTTTHEGTTSAQSADPQADTRVDTSSPQGSDST